MEAGLAFAAVMLVWWVLSSRRRVDRTRHADDERRTGALLAEARERETALIAENDRLYEAQHRAQFDEHGVRKTPLTKKQIMSMPDEALSFDELTEKMEIETRARARTKKAQ